MENPLHSQHSQTFPHIPTKGHTEPLAFPSTLSGAESAGYGNATPVREQEYEDYDPESPFIPELQHRCPRMAAGWNAMREALLDGDQHTWRDIAEIGSSAGDIKYTTASSILKLATKYGYIGSLKPRGRNAYHTNRKIWLA
jgi:hypothetical protein